MDRGGIARKRGYLWLAAVLLVALLIVIFIALRTSPAKPFPEVGPETVDSFPEPTQQHTPARYGLAKGRANYQRSAYGSLGGQNATAQVEPVSPPAHIYHKSKYITIELNSADSLDLVQLYNIGPTFARRILKYRSLLGGFVSTEQLWEIYGMDSVRYNDIAPHVTVNPEGVTLMDINSVTIDQLKRHPYLDYYQAKAIVRMREQTGLYKDIEDLLKVPIIDNETYTKLKPYLTCNSQQNK